MQDLNRNYMLEGIVEMDEAYLGASKGEKARGHGTERKIAVHVSKTEEDSPCPFDFSCFLTLQ